MVDVMKYANYRLHEVDSISIVAITNLLNKYHKEGNRCEELRFIQTLNKNGLYPVWSMPSHRGTYYFPTEADCELWEDYIFQCID